MEYPIIKLRQGATSIVDLDLTDFDFQGGSVVMTMSRRGLFGNPLRTWEFTTAEVHSIVFEDEFTAGLRVGNHNYEYDIMWHLDEERFAQCAPSPIEVSRTVGGLQNDPDD